MREVRLARVSQGPVADPVYRRLLGAQVIALVGTGVTTVALGLVAYDLAGPDASTVLGIALAVKMIAYVGLAPVIAAVAHRVDRRRLLVALDLGRVAPLVALPFATEVWQLLVLVFVLNACAAGFTPAFQATVADVVADPHDYARALSLSRVAYDAGELVSPALAAGLLLLVATGTLFAINALAFVVSAVIVVRTTLPPADREDVVSDRTVARITDGVRRFVRVPRLRGVLLLTFAAASASAMVIVNTVVIVRDDLGLGPASVAVAFAGAGAGSMAGALAAPALLRRLSDRMLMATGGALLAGALPFVALVGSLLGLVVVWGLVGVGLGFVQTPAGLVLRRSVPASRLGVLLAAHFALSHACWLLTYPAAGLLGSGVGPAGAAIVASAACAVAVIGALASWRPEPVAPGG